ncbi:receptor-type tyrosine-protein phosphatase H-like [Embiotoca jacksoni]|uniref:receptor-type tyrosine-protein phosphatase H-like n=1 Tax=Embiotoca jacksoni TaxID=100190 RepID=UPI003703D78D
MMKILSFTTTSDHLLLCAFLSLLWGVSESTTPTSSVTMTTAVITATKPEPKTTLLTTSMTTAKPSPPPDTTELKSVGQNETSITLQWTEVPGIDWYTLVFNETETNFTASAGLQTHIISDLTSGTEYKFTLFTVFENIRSSGVNLTAVTAPLNAKEFKSVGQNETSITLQWTEGSEIHNYTLVFDGGEININSSEKLVTHTISNLKNGTEYKFTLFTVFENISSSGVNLTAVTAPRNADELKSVEQNETSITLQWTEVPGIHRYTLVFNGIETNFTASAGLQRHTISDLTSGTEYKFTLFTVFENIRSSGVNLTAVTAPLNAKEFKSVGQNETSITLQWTEGSEIHNYTLVFDGGEININSSEKLVTHTISNLKNGTEYKFTLFTVFENISSSGVNLTAVTAPLNAKEFKSVGQNETSITLQWTEGSEIHNYTLVFDGGEININSSEELVTHTISNLKSGTEHKFTLFTVFENISSSGVNLTAVTAPRNADELKSVEQNETSITLQWTEVSGIHRYTLVFNETETNFTTSAGLQRHTISDLTSGTEYKFTLFTVFENIRSSGVNLTAVTAPLNAKEFKSVGQNETSITLQWTEGSEIHNYTLVFDGGEININSSEKLVTHTISNLKSGTEYKFTLFTVFENISSSGVNLTAVTAPRNADELKSVEQNETSITLQWTEVPGIHRYTLVFNGIETNFTTSAGLQRHTISDLTSGTEYKFTLFTVFENIRSSGVNLTAVTAPRNADELKSVEQNETSITLQWTEVPGIHRYTLVFNGIETNFTTSAGLQRHTISDLTSGTEYKFTLFTVFENIRSSGVNLTAVTAPLNAKEFKSVGQNETSITLQWTEGSEIHNYTLVFDGGEININSSEELVTHTISNLKSGTEHKFTLFTVFENISSSGVNLTAVTAPRNADELKSVGQNETSITLQWTEVSGIHRYTLIFNGAETNFTTSAGLQRHTISDLTSGTEYKFTLFTVFENIRSSGVNLTAVTAPETVQNVTVLSQNETSITLMWYKVKNISTYFLLYDDMDNGSHVMDESDGSLEEASVTHEVSLLNAGTRYYFTLITVFGGVNSTGHRFTVPTVPPEVLLVNVTERLLTTITLKWENKNTDWEYLVQVNGTEYAVIPGGSSHIVSYSVTPLEPGKLYAISVITLFSRLTSTAYEVLTVTAIDCAKVNWHVTNSSIRGTIEGLFSNATATNKSQTHVSPGGRNVTFTGLYPGATYDISLMYEEFPTPLQQCRHNLTVLPPVLSAHCEYWASGYSVFIAWNKPNGVWTTVEVNVNGKNSTVHANNTRIIIPGFQPAKTYTVSVASLSGSIRSSEPFVFSCATDPRGVIAGSVFAVLFFGVLVCVAIFIFLKRPDIISRKKAFIGGSKQSNTADKPISIAKFPEHFYQLKVDENRAFSREYEDLIPIGTDQIRRVAILPENKGKNRFNNVMPYDWCRVKLTTLDPNGTSDYINASYMPGYNSNREYIATQGPLPSTLNDFWRMIWEESVKRIVMVANCTEGGRTKCERYWPGEGKPCIYGELVVTTRSERQEPDWTLREFSVKHRDTAEERTVKHFHFTAWPDHGVPQCTEVLIEFRRLVRWHIEKEGGRAPTVVHCSAGVGRTGTIIALDVLLQQLEKERAVGINAFVRKMRLNRPYMVQTESQYVFLHQCIMDCLQPYENGEENIYENTESIYVNATALREFTSNRSNT